MGGTRQRHFDGTNLKPRKRFENAQTPTTPAPAYFAGVWVHAVLGGDTERKACELKNNTIANTMHSYKESNLAVLTVFE